MKVKLSFMSVANAATHGHSTHNQNRSSRTIQVHYSLLIPLYIDSILLIFNVKGVQQPRVEDSGKPPAVISTRKN
jgi:hypothetical protein